MLLGVQLKRGREKGRNPTAGRKRDRCMFTHRSGKAKNMLHAVSSAAFHAKW